MNAQVLCFVPLGWIGLTLSKIIVSCVAITSAYVSTHRIKDRLRSGEMTVPGDQRPIFLYAGYKYDPENPWKGLFKSTILVCVSSLLVLASYESLIV